MICCRSKQKGWIPAPIMIWRNKIEMRLLIAPRYIIILSSLRERATKSHNGPQTITKVLSTGRRLSITFGFGFWTFQGALGFGFGILFSFTQKSQRPIEGKIRFFYVEV